MLQRLLSVAAAATAASLMGGNPEEAVNDLRRTAVNVEGEDGSFDNFLQALRNGRLASHLGRNTTNGGDGSDDGGTSNPNSLDFFRMFRFGPNGVAGNRSSAPAATGRGNEPVNNVPNATNGQQTSEQNSEPEARTVSILIVGIRSLNQDADSQDGPDREQDMPSFIDALANMNTTINVGLQDHGANVPVGSPRTGAGLSNLARNRRASMGGLFAGRERTRRARVHNTGRPVSEIGPPSSMMPDLAESPGLQGSEEANAATDSSLPQGNITASEPVDESLNRSPLLTPSAVPPSPTTSRFRESWRNSWRPSLRDSWHSSRDNRHSLIDATPDEDTERPRRRATRRRSASEAMRFGSGSSRRNGVVEPDRPPPDGESHRSWIIYVLGGSYPENHPILTTPSLFTDNPTYEDMVLLSSLLGPAKPPVAQRQDVESSGGLFRIELVGSALVARGVVDDGDDGFRETIHVDPAQNCQICLSTYGENELARRLHDCKHLFHQECIDEVSSA